MKVKMNLKTVVLFLYLFPIFYNAGFVKSENSHNIEQPRGSEEYFGDFTQFCDYLTEKKIMSRCKKAKELRSFHVKSLIKLDLSKTKTSDIEKVEFMLDYTRDNVDKDDKICEFFHLRNTIYVTKIEKIGSLGKSNAAGLIACTDLPEGYTVNEASVCRKPHACINPIELNIDQNVIPPNSGMLLGPSSNYKFIGMNLQFGAHYSLPIVENPGYRITGTKTPPENYLGVIHSDGFYNPKAGMRAVDIPPGYQNYIVRTSCTIDAADTLFLLQHEAHTNALGKVANLFVYSRVKNETTKVSSISKPWRGLPASLGYPIPVYPNDVVIATCVYNTIQKTTPTKMGVHPKDEKCEMRVLFSTKSTDKSDHFIHCSEAEYLPVENWIWHTIESELYLD